jgi:hypothetical protein
MEAIFVHISQNLDSSEYTNTFDLLLQLIERLIMWETFKQELITIIIKVGEGEHLTQIGSHLLKKFIIAFLAKNLNAFKDKGFMVKLIQAYLVDENSGVYEQTTDLLFKLQECVSTDLFIKVINHLQSKVNNSIILIREVELILRFLNSYDDSSVIDRLGLINSNFFDYDLLTQLTIMDTFDKCVEKSSVVSRILSDLNFFEKLQDVDCSNELLRKILYTYSKFYAKGLVAEDKFVKNLLVIALQYYADNGSENYFILSFLVNVFHNKNVFDFLNNPDNNGMFNFNDHVVSAIIDTYHNHDPNVKMHCLELLKLLGDFTVPSLGQEVFLNKLIIGFYKYEFDKVVEVDQGLKFFVDKLYKDFKIHDFEEYEESFLQTLLSKFMIILGLISYEPFVKRMVANFDFMLYILNRRLRSQEICLLKFKIIEELGKSNVATTTIDKGLLDQINNYIIKGAY